MLIGEMLKGVTPIDDSYLNTIKIVVNSKRMDFDFLILSGIGWLVSRRAKRLFEDIGTKEISYYPFAVNTSTYYLIMTKNMDYVVNKSKSDIDRANHNNFNYPYRKIVFNKQLLTDPMIFSVVSPFAVGDYATESVKTAVEEAKLRGWQFVHCEKEEGFGD